MGLWPHGRADREPKVNFFGPSFVSNPVLLLLLSSSSSLRSPCPLSLPSPPSREITRTKRETLSPACIKFLGLRNLLPQVTKSP